ncbi:PAS domain S-box protein [Cytophagaceae bacterium ABcell3]|nr:PAS domain S-box protein [Cytophagaceae bacterium ABcell3]
MNHFLENYTKSLETGVYVFNAKEDNVGGVQRFQGKLVNSEDGEGRKVVVIEGDTGDQKLYDCLKNVYYLGNPQMFTWHVKKDGLWLHVHVMKYKEELLVCCNNITKQKETEAELRKRERTYRLLTENSTDMICRLNFRAQFLYVSPSSLKVLGYHPEELLGKSFYSFVHPDDYGHVKNINLKFVQDPQLTTIEFRFRCKNGNYKWIETITKPIIDSDGKFLEIQSSVRDVTERKQFEDQLRNLNQELEKRVVARTMHLSAVLQNAPVVLWSVNNKKNITVFDGKGLEKLNMKPNSLSGISIYEAFTDYPNVIKNVEEALKGKSFEKELGYKGRFYREFYFPFRDSLGDIQGMTAIATDITERRKFQEKLAASEAKYKSMIEGIPQLVWTALPNGEVDFFNNNWYNYTGLTKTGSLNKNWISVIHPDDTKAVLEKVSDGLERKEVLTYEARFKNIKTSQYRWHLARVWPAKDNNGKVIKWLGTATDIHDQKKQNEELKLKNLELTKINNDLDNFIYTASHDLKAPISNIEGLFQAIEDSMDGQCSDEIGVMVHMAEESIERLRDTIAELTEISRVQKDFYAGYEKVDIQQVVNDFFTDNQETIKNSHAQFLVELDKKHFLFSKKNFRTIVHNLLSNAIKYKHPERAPIILIKTYEDRGSGELVLVVKDNGIGFKNEDAGKIFKMFKRVHDHVEGTGVGLYIVKRIMENTGGKIHVESKVGAGSAFTLRFRLQSSASGSEKDSGQNQ